MSAEDELIERLRALHAVPDADVPIAIGDDAAVLTVAGNLVLSVDACVEGTHFRTDFFQDEGRIDWATVGDRAATAALSDLAAMGSRPVAVLSSLAAPSDAAAVVAAIAQGTERAARRVGAFVVGGNLARADAVSIHTTVVGAASDPITRRGARPGDGLYVTGPTGEAALGLELLLRAEGDVDAWTMDEAHRVLVEAWRHPRAHVAEGLALQGHAHACMDVSDGLALDLSRLCGASGVGATLDFDALPLSDDGRRVAASLGLDVERLLLHGGESYVLLFASAARPPVECVRVGVVDGARGIRVRRDGATRTVEPTGFDHFRSED